LDFYDVPDWSWKVPVKELKVFHFNDSSRPVKISSHVPIHLRKMQKKTAANRQLLD
jgi:hypothetical protein